MEKLKKHLVIVMGILSLVIVVGSMLLLRMFSKESDIELVTIEGDAQLLDDVVISGVIADDKHDTHFVLENGKWDLRSDFLVRDTFIGPETVDPDYLSERRGGDDGSERLQNELGREYIGLRAYLYYSPLMDATTSRIVEKQTLTDPYQEGKSYPEKINGSSES